jgi:hypothetical protein
MEDFVEKRLSGESSKKLDAQYLIGFNVFLNNCKMRIKS